MALAHSSAHVPMVQLAPDGPAVSRIVAGAWRMAEWGLSPQARLDWIHAALDLGISTFDHADIYGDYQCEALFGEALALQPGLRDRLQLVSKCGIKLVSAQRPAHVIKHYDTSAAHIQASVEASLQALRTDHLDVLLIHRPDPLMDADEVAGCFERLRASGKVRHFGVSNHTPSQFALLHKRCPLVTNQVECSPLALAALHDGTLDQSQDLGVLPMIWSPLGGGRLFQASEPAAQRVQAVLSALAVAHGVSVATVAYAWLLRHPSTPVPITGSGRLAGLVEAAQACGLALDRSAWHAIWSAGAGHEVP